MQSIIEIRAAELELHPSYVVLRLAVFFIDTLHARQCAARASARVESHVYVHVRTIEKRGWLVHAYARVYCLRSRRSERSVRYAYAPYKVRSHDCFPAMRQVLSIYVLAVRQGSRATYLLSQLAEFLVYRF